MTLHLLFLYRSHHVRLAGGEDLRSGQLEATGDSPWAFQQMVGDSSLAQNEPQQDLTLPQANSEWITSPYVKNATELFTRKSEKIFEA